LLPFFSQPPRPPSPPPPFAVLIPHFRRYGFLFLRFSYIFFCNISLSFRPPPVFLPFYLPFFSSFSNSKFTTTLQAPDSSVVSTSFWLSRSVIYSFGFFWLPLTAPAPPPSSLCFHPLLFVWPLFFGWSGQAFYFKNPFFPAALSLLGSFHPNV